MSLRGLAQQVSLDAEGRYQPMHTAVAVDRDKNSQQAVKWAIDHLVANNPSIVIVHVRNPATIAYGDTSPDAAREQIETEAAELFLSYRGFCARKGVAMKEIILEESDVSKALVEFVIVNNISNIVVGSSSRYAITRKFRNPDVPTNLTKFAPDFCTVYVISKGKATTVRSAKVQAPPPGAPRQPLIPASPRHYHSGSMESDEASRMPLSRGSWRGQIPPSPVAEKRSFERNGDYTRTPTRDVVRQLQPGKPAAGNALPYDNAEGSFRPSRAPSRESFSDDLDFHGAAAACPSSDTSADLMEHLQPPSCESPPDSIPPEAANGDVEAELRRLRLELKQTMDMYSTACKEAISAKQKARELNQWKQEELRRVEVARQAEESARAMVELEKAKCRAALEAAEAAHRLAEREAQKRLSAEMIAKREAVEKKRALEALNNNDVRYRKYTIEEIELATDFFTQSLKIGEGGYGPVYKACLDHTPVAIKVLRPDAAQGRKQFLQEVEVLSRIRHPNMVLLLGACPEYGCLVYEYMDNGSLEDRLFCRGNTPPIPWHVRFKIAAEIATALLFLHQTKPEPLVHRDLKPANILLDRNYVSKISDVGLARLVPPSVANAVTQYHMTSTAGTFCYIDPEYQQTGMLGTKSDVYSLGIMLMQIITAKPPMGLAHHVQRAIENGVFDEMLDPSVPDWPVEDALGYARLALQCAELKRKDRPDLATVVLPELNRLRNLWDRQEPAYGSGGRSAAAASTGSTPSGFSCPRPPRSATPPTSSQARSLRNSAVQEQAIGIRGEPENQRRSTAQAEG